MKRIVFILTLAVFCVSIAASADVFVKMETNTDEYYRGGRVQPAENETSEMWIAEKKMAYISDSLKLIIDLDKNLYTLITPSDNGYVQGELPLAFGKILSEEETAQVTMYAYQGSVKKLGTTKKVGEWPCQGYEIQNWIPYQDGKVNERDMEAWVTTDVPCDLKTLNEMTRHLLALSNFSDELITELLTIEGLRIAADTTRYTEGMAITSTERVVEMEEKEAPAGTYDVPEGATKKEVLTLADLRG